MHASFIARRRGPVVASIGFVVALTLVVAWPVPSARATGGDQLWVARYDGPAKGFDHPTGLAVSPDGSRVFVTGYGPGAEPSADYATLAYDAANGAQVWVRRYDGKARDFDLANALALSPDGTRVYVSGQSIGLGTLDDFATVAYDAATGDRIWLRRYDGPHSGSDVGLRLATSPDGSWVFVTGRGDRGPGTSPDYVTVAYDAATGSRVWVRRYDGPGGYEDWPNAISVSPDSTRVFVTGASHGGTPSGYATVAYDAATGDKLWVRRYGGNQATSLAVSPDGARVYVTGWSYGGGATLDDYATLAYDAETGVKVWLRRYDGPPHSYDLGSSVSVSADGSRVYVTGASTGDGTSYDYATVAYEAVTGVKAWVHRYDGPVSDEDWASSVSVSPDGTEVFVTGSSTGFGTSFDFATLAYDAVNGDELWARRYDGPVNGEDYAWVVTPSPVGGSVFMTGHSHGTGAWNDWDYATIAYSTG